ncbi:head-tail joining protein [Chitinibacteraceae bacterium HSL-7]
MASDPFTRMAGRLLDVLGQPAVLRGEVATRAALEHGVLVYGEYGQLTGTVSVATLPSSVAARQHDTLAVDGKSYVLDRLERNDGLTVRYIVREG